MPRHALESLLGTLSSLTTTAKTTLVAAINELDAEHGVLSSLTTTTKTTLVAAINELVTDRGTLASLTTTAKTTLVAAINEVNAKTVTVAMLPANSTLVLAKSGSTWPGVPTTRTDIIIIWKGADPSPSVVASRTLNSPGMLDGVDIRLVI